MQKNTYDQIERMIGEGDDINNESAISLWSMKVANFLAAALGESTKQEFENLYSEDEWKKIAMRIGYLQGILAKGRDEADPNGYIISEESKIEQQKDIPGESDPRKIFVVHGHDEGAKESTARFLEKLKLQPVILHEQPSGGRTIIEKFEKYSGDVGFAVVLLTPDDVGSIKDDAKNLLPRARQNVVLELGYFMGRLTRNRVCALYKEGVELPSDIQGVIYVKMDEEGAWKAKLAQEILQAKITINIEGLISG